jgi:hypothetical protein
MKTYTHNPDGNANFLKCFSIPLRKLAVFLGVVKEFNAKFSM